MSAGLSVPRHATFGSHSFYRPATGGWKSWSSGRPVWALWVFRLPLALEVPWGWLGGAVGVQAASNSSTKAKSFQIAFLSHPPSWCLVWGVRMFCRIRFWASRETKAMGVFFIQSQGYCAY